jgi:hypothetical protein
MRWMLLEDWNLSKVCETLNEQNKNRTARKENDKVFISASLKNIIENEFILKELKIRVKICRMVEFILIPNSSKICFDLFKTLSFISLILSERN